MNRYSALALGSVFAIAAACAAVGGALAQPAQESLTVTEIVLSKGFDNHAPVNPGTTFSRSDGRIYATVRVANPQRVETTIRVAFERAGHPTTAGGINLDIPAQRTYRTLARTGTARAAGSYRCVVYDAEGHELSSVPFELTE